MGYVSVIGALALAAYLALYFAAWGAFARRHLERPLRSLFILPAAWVVLEYLRSILLTGFGWNPLAHTQWNWLEILQVAEVTGAWGIGFLIVLVNAALFQCLRRDAPARTRKVCAAVALLLLGTAFAYGRLRLPVVGSYPSSTFRVCLAQGDIPQVQKWEETFRDEIWGRYEGAMREAARGKPQIIVWPETAVPGFLEEPPVRARLEELARSADCALLAGVPTEQVSTGLLFNSAALFDREGREMERYDKIHLVPFGEYVPLKPLFGWLENVVPIGDFSPGRAFTVFRLPSEGPPGQPWVARFSVLVCFEDLFPGLARGFVREGARWLVVITNDAWFGRSAASLQHLQASVLRAVENRVWVARAANTGWTGFVDSAGRRFGIRRFEPGVATGQLPSYTEVDESPAPYTRWGDWFVALCALLAAGLPLRRGSGQAFLPSRRQI